MPVIISSDQTLITKTIDNFPGNYHADYHMVRPHGIHYLAADSIEVAAVPQLVSALRIVLRNWGAEQRSAPNLRSRSEFIKILSSEKLHECLSHLSSYSMHTMRISNGQRSFVAQESDSGMVDTFDTYLLWSLKYLADGLFIGANNATYPMKSLMLITGLMPAFDCQVRKGLKHGGFYGMSNSSFPLPRDTCTVDGKKLTRLPFLLGECWNQNNSLIRSAVRKSRYSELESEPGRIFDILLFMQADPDRRILVS